MKIKIQRTINIIMNYQWCKLLNNNIMRLGLTNKGLKNYSLLRVENFQVNSFYKKNDVIANLKYKKGIIEPYINLYDGYLNNVNFELISDLKKLSAYYCISDSDLWLFDIELNKFR